MLFPNSEVAFETWQFGQLDHISLSDPVLADSLSTLLVDHMYSALLPRLTQSRLVFVCFGRVLHRLATRLAARFVEQGTTHLHIVLAHDYYSPTLVCAPSELQGADITVMVDVIHTGGLLERLFAACRQHAPAHIRGFALIDQSCGAPFTHDTLAVWREEQEERISIGKFKRTATAESQKRLTRFEPNDECTNSVHSSSAPTLPSGRLQLVSDDSDLLKMIHRSGALRRDYAISGKRYPYVINVLDFLRDPHSKRRLSTMAVEALADVESRRSCIVYHSGRRARAGTLAKLMGETMRLPVIALGSKGSSFALRWRQREQLSGYRTTIIVDSAIRTGESLGAMVRAIDDAGLRTGRKVVAFCVLDALSRVSRRDLARTLGIEIRTLFQVPLAPPTERVRSWANSKKSEMRSELAQSGKFRSVEAALRTYCEHVKRPGNTRTNLSLDETKVTLDKARNSATGAERASASIDKACKEGKDSLIRHLPLDQVVHDRSVQDLLIGVMYNSMKPSFKEGAIFGLAAAQNYDWMTYEWLQCNRRFLESSAECWKSVLMVECQLKLDRREAELSRFSAALEKFAAHVAPSSCGRRSQQKQKRLAYADNSEPRRRKKAPSSKRERRLSERIGLMLDVAHSV